MRVTPEQQQTCKVCGRPDKFDFHVPDEIWEAVVPPEFQRHVVCLTCFDDFAIARDIDYARWLAKDFYFAGQRACFRFAIASALDVHER